MYGKMPDFRDPVNIAICGDSRQIRPACKMPGPTGLAGWALRASQSRVSFRRRSPFRGAKGGRVAHQMQCAAGMKIAIPHWQSRVSPVCDEALRFLVVEMADGQELGRKEFEMRAPGIDMAERAARLLDWGVDTLICGAVSCALETLLQGVGIQVIPQVCGDIEEVLRAFHTGTLEQDRFTLPGCGGRKRRRRRAGACRRELAEYPNDGTKNPN